MANRQPSATTPQSLPDPRVGDGGPFVLDPTNFQMLQDALQGRRFINDGPLPGATDTSSRAAFAPPVPPPTYPSTYSGVPAWPAAMASNGGMQAATAPLRAWMRSVQSFEGGGGPFPSFGNVHREPRSARDGSAYRTPTEEYLTHGRQLHLDSDVFLKLGLRDGVLARTMEGMVHAGRSTEAGMFDFDLGELLRFMAFMTPPIMVGTVLVRALMHLWATWTGRKPRVSPWPVAMMLVMVSIPVIWVLFWDG